MRELTLEVRKITGGETWLEEYDADNLTGTHSSNRRVVRVAVNNFQEAIDWGKGTVERYNANLRPGETKRELVNVTLTEEDG